ncbi:MAG TPA: hypothetical protein VMT34_13520 [Aggregatilineales bacterium]|nr:hypothetical protein [Aggregatilineales bacterium]
MTLELETSRVHCPHCGYIRPDEISGLENKIATVSTQKPRPYVEIVYKGEILAAAMAAFDTGQDSLYHGDTQAAMQSFQRAATFQPDFVDAYLWIAKSAGDVRTQREALEMVLSLTPSNLEAQRMMMVLDGQLTPEEAARTTGDHVPQVRTVLSAAARTTALLCPQCGGELTVDEAREQVVCRFCGYTAPHLAGVTHEETLSKALLKRKAQKVLWNVGVRIIQCQQCGAEFTIPAKDLSVQCRFCGSKQVILSDSFGSFEQPESLIPFTVTPLEAVTAIEKHLQAFTEKLAALLEGAPTTHPRSVEGLFLPFWVFSVTLEIIQYPMLSPQVGGSDTAVSSIDMVNAIPVVAVKMLSPELIQHISSYDMDASVPYDPRWLASCPAQLYQIDFDRASLEAREIASRRMRSKYKPEVQRSGPDEQPIVAYHTMSQVQSMTFHLMLLPIWISKLGGKRIAVVNGQTGKTALGSL